MAARDIRIGGISIGGILVIVGIIVALFWSPSSASSSPSSAYRLRRLRQGEVVLRRG